MVFVPGTAPGDVADIRIVETHKNFLVGELVALIEPGARRVQAPCPVFGRCGGCTWQHIAYEEQIQQKQQILESAFRRLAKTHSMPALLPMVPSPQPYRYRNRIQVQRQGDRVGFFQARTHDLVEVEDCLISQEVVAREIRNVVTHPPAPKYEIARTEKGNVAVAPVGGDRTEAFFSQVNTAQNAALIRSVLHAVKNESSSPPTTILDLYCGTGNFSFPLAHAFPSAKVTGVELSKKNIELANQRLKADGPSNLDFFASDVSHFLEKIQRVESPLTLIVDPPRTGIEKRALSAVLELHPERIVYISCQPMTLVRDLQVWVESGYDIRSVQGFDMFPQTAHIETQVMLRRRKS